MEWLILIVIVVWLSWARAVSDLAEPKSNDLEIRLRKLQDLKAKGLIDDADYAKRKAEIISKI